MISQPAFPDLTLSTPLERNGHHRPTAERRAPAIPSPREARRRRHKPIRPAGPGESATGRHGLREREDEPSAAPAPLQIVILGLPITSSWGDGHAATCHGLARELSARGHQLLFLERDLQRCGSNGDLPQPPCGRVALYANLKQLKERFAPAVRQADVVLVGSNLQQGAEIGAWVTRTAQGATAFYDGDTPVTLAKLAQGDLDYLSRALIPRFALYLSFTGGPILETLEQRFGSPMARPLYASVDPSAYYPEPREKKWDLGYRGTYSEDRQPALDELFLEPARNWAGGRFAVAGPHYPKVITWPGNVRRYNHLSPARHRAFYNAQQFTLNVTRAHTAEAGYAPSVRLFEAAACGTPIISDYWAGLDSFFEPNQEILIADSAEESLYYLLETTAAQRQSLAAAARARVLAQHTDRHRAFELEAYILDVLRRPSLAAGAAG